jgi:hypothetical protein
MIIKAAQSLKNHNGGQEWGDCHQNPKNITEMIMEKIKIMRTILRGGNNQNDSSHAEHRSAKTMIGKQPEH